MEKIKQISHLTCKLKFLEFPSVHSVSVCTIIAAWLSERKLFSNLFLWYFRVDAKSHPCPTIKKIQ